MNAAALQNFRRTAVQALTATFPGVVTLAGRQYNGAVKLQPVLLSIPGQGTIEHRGLTALILKTDLPAEPVIDSVLTHGALEYIVNSFTGREEYEVHWRLICIEKDRN